MDTRIKALSNDRGSKPFEVCEFGAACVYSAMHWKASETRIAGIHLEHI